MACKLCNLNNRTVYDAGTVKRHFQFIHSHKKTFRLFRVSLTKFAKYFRF